PSSSSPAPLTPPPRPPLFPYTTLFRSCRTPHGITFFTALEYDSIGHSLSLHHPGNPRINLLRHIFPRIGHISPQRTGRSAGICEDRKSTRLNSSHGSISYAVFCLKKKS